MKTAHCSCGELRIDCEGDPLKVSACHCLECQRRTGSAFGVGVFYDRTKVAIHGMSTVYTRGGDGGLSVSHHFCLRCGSTVFWYPEKRPHLVAVAIGCFADTAFPGPTLAVYLGTRQPGVYLQIVGAGLLAAPILLSTHG